MNLLEKLFIGDHKIVNRGAIDLYRIVFALGGLIFSINTLDQFYLLFNFASGSDFYFYQAIIYLWILSSLILIFFAPSRIFLIAYYLIVDVVFSSHQGVFNVEGKYMVLGTFFNIFLPLGKRSLMDSKDYKIIMLHLFVVTGYLFFGGFITKALDPTWANGLGLYFVMVLPWIKYPFLDILLKSQFTMKAMNYYVLFVELCSFLFSIFAFTRKFGIFLVWCFCLFLFLLLQISTIGFSAFAFALLFLAIYPQRVGFLQRRFVLDLDLILNQILPFRLILNYVEKLNILFIRFRSFILGGLFGFFIVVLIRDADNAFFHDRFRRIWVYVDKANIKSYCLFFDNLFTSMHFADVVEYRVKIKLKNGQMVEPVKVFNEDKTGGLYSGWPFNARWLQAEMYRFNDYSIYKELDEKKELHWAVKKLFRYLETKVDGQGIESFHFCIAQLKMPEKYDPNGCDYAASSPWREILVYYPDTKNLWLPEKKTKMQLTK